MTKILQLLCKNYHLGIVTNGTASWQYNKIDVLGYKYYFSKIEHFHLGRGWRREATSSHL
ncbi:hypothetical protein DX130_02825 [Paenibacillus paeoniae]|uniref:HAD family hydrolase n=1 Tax=Paenibacillus paeoniae TaxID=2292705 RepID=A0A371PJB7_9BACL|nr:hypothetical protein DX130_02825 [Paenibacillus paeoniae]